MDLYKLLVKNSKKIIQDTPAKTVFVLENNKSITWCKRTTQITTDGGLELVKELLEQKIQEEQEEETPTIKQPRTRRK